MTDTLSTILASTEPWIANPGLIGGVLGGGVGIFGGLYGTVVGICAPRGVARGLVFGLHWTMAVLGAVLALTGLVAVVRGQPYHVWFGFLMPGLLLCVFAVVFLPVIRLRYRQAEARKLEAEEFRRT